MTDPRDGFITFLFKPAPLKIRTGRQCGLAVADGTALPTMTNPRDEVIAFLFRSRPTKDPTRKAMRACEVRVTWRGRWKRIANYDRLPMQSHRIPMQVLMHQRSDPESKVGLGVGTTREPVKSMWCSGIRTGLHRIRMRPALE